VAVTRLIGRGLEQSRPVGGDIPELRRHAVCVVRAIDAHQWLTAPDFLTRIDQALDDLTGHSKGEVRFHARFDDSSEAPQWRNSGHNPRDLDELGFGPRVPYGSGRLAAGEAAGR
jgi:hypothetical protein